MGWSLRLGEFAGTTVRMHLTFLLLIAWVAALYWMRDGPAAALDGVLFVVLVFACVVLHEYGHVLAARRYGIATKDITLLPIGGLASMERMPERPGQEIVVAVAGPLVNVAIAAILIVVLGARFDLADAAGVHEASMSLAGRLAAVNLILVAFNAIPAFPMDGGRVLRALLAMRMDRVRATRLAARIGQGFAAAFVFLGLLGNPLLILIGVFVWIAAAAESRQVEEVALARGRLARDAMIRRFETLSPGATADDAARLLLATTQQEFPVLGSDGAFLGVVTRKGLVDALSASGPATPVTAFLDPEVPLVAETEPLERVMEALAKAPSKVVAVRDRAGALSGYVTLENLSELFMLAGATGNAR